MRIPRHDFLWKQQKRKKREGKENKSKSKETQKGK
jgi:hypothetical protein